MANLYKMAKAFGRAIANGGDDKAIKKIIGPQFKQGKNTYSERLSGKTANTPENKALQEGWDEESARLDYNMVRPSDQHKQFTATDDALQRDFDEAFENAIKAYKDSGRPQSDEIRESSIEALKQGVAPEKVIDWLYGKIKQPLY